jgi:hypothetical protein
MAFTGKKDEERPFFRADQVPNSGSLWVLLSVSLTHRTYSTRTLQAKSAVWLLNVFTPYD